MKKQGSRRFWQFFAIFPTIFFLFFRKRWILNPESSTIVIESNIFGTEDTRQRQKNNNAVCFGDLYMQTNTTP